MSDVPGSVPPNGGAQAIPPASAGNPPFPGTRLLYAIGFGVIAWFVFWIIILLAAVQFGVILLNGRSNEELKRFNISLVQYLWELLAYVTFFRDEQPFPIGPFPKQA